MGESRLFERDGTWYLHVTATRDVEERSEVPADERTAIGVDIGEASLVTVCRRDDYGSPTAPELWADEAKTLRRLRKTYFTAKRRIQTHGSECIAESFGDDLWRQTDDVFHRVTREVVEYAESVENPRSCSGRPDVYTGVDGLRRLHEPASPRMGVRQTSRADTLQSRREGYPCQDGEPAQHLEGVPRLR